MPPRPRDAADVARREPVGQRVERRPQVVGGVEHHLVAGRLGASPGDDDAPVAPSFGAGVDERAGLAQGVGDAVGQFAGGDRGEDVRLAVDGDRYGGVVTAGGERDQECEGSAT